MVIQKVFCTILLFVYLLYEIYNNNLSFKMISYTNRRNLIAGYSLIKCFSTKYKQLKLILKWLTESKFSDLTLKSKFVSTVSTSSQRPKYFHSFSVLVSIISYTTMPSLYYIISLSKIFLSWSIYQNYLTIPFISRHPVFVLIPLQIYLLVLFWQIENKLSYLCV